MKVFYTKRMVADSGGFSPSAHKPREVVASWRALGVPLEIVEPEPITADQFALAHDSQFVEDVLACRRDNGFGNRSPAVAASLPYTSGAMLAAAREAVRNGRVAVAPCSGFHHATHESPQGFCTFNGLMVAACFLKGEAAVQRPIACRSTTDCCADSEDEGDAPHASRTAALPAGADVVNHQYWRAVLRPLNIVIAEPVRTGIGSYGGSLKAMPATELGAAVIRAALGRARIEPNEVGAAVMGQVVQAGAKMNPARQAAIGAGVPVSVPAMTVNRVCGSGAQAIIRGARSRLGRDLVRRGGRHGEHGRCAVSRARRALGLSHGRCHALRQHAP